MEKKLTKLAWRLQQPNHQKVHKYTSNPKINIDQLIEIWHVRHGIYDEIKHDSISVLVWRGKVIKKKVSQREQRWVEFKN